MPLDSSIPLQTQGPDIQSPQNLLMAQLRTQAMQGQVDQQQQQYGRQNALMSALQQPGTFDADGRFNRKSLPAVAAADPTQVSRYAEMADQGDQAKMQQARQRVQMQAQLLGSAKDEPSYQRAKQIYAANGGDVSKLPESYDAGFVQQALQSALTADQQFDQQYKLHTQKNDDAKLALDARKQDFTEGQNKFSAAGDGTVFNTQTGLGPDGAPLQPKDKGLNDGQAKANLFGSRAAESDRILEQLSSQGVDRPSMIKGAAESVPFIGGALGTVANAVAASPQQQQVEQAQRDFVNSVLRRESGAAIAPSEFDNAKKQYFPSIGDAPEVIAQKAANRKLAIKGIMAEVPAAFQAKQGGQSGAGAGKTITRRGTAPDGRTVVQYSDGTTGYQ